jgi:hypothetical protein
MGDRQGSVRRMWIARAIWFLGAAVITVCLAWGFEQILPRHMNPASILAALLVSTLMALGISRRADRPRTQRGQARQILWGETVPAVVVTWTAVLWEQYGRLLTAILLRLLHRLQPIFGPLGISFLGAATVGLVGSALYQLRERRRPTYAILEMVFALFSGANAMAGLAQVASPQHPIDPTAAIKLFASAYLMVRGWDNWCQGKREQEDRMLSLRAGEIHEPSAEVLSVV